MPISHAISSLIGRVHGRRFWLLRTRGTIHAALVAYLGVIGASRAANSEDTIGKKRYRIMDQLHLSRFCPIQKVTKTLLRTGGEPCVLTQDCFNGVHALFVNLHSSPSPDPVPEKLTKKLEIGIVLRTNQMSR